MSLHTQCPKRIASTSAHRTVWRRWAVRCYATSTADDPEWFTQVRNSLLSRKPSFYKEYLDPLHNGQLRKALQGFQPKPSLKGAGPTTVLLPELLTRFNARMPSATLLPDGTDPLHSPGGPWVRRMWAGGAVRLNSSLQLAPGLPLDPQKMVACLERITDVRLQGTGTAAKIFVTVQRSVAQNEKALGVGKHLSKPELIADTPQQVDRSKDWRAVLLKEERNLVFMKSKTEAEHTTAPSGESFVPRYLKSPTAPDYYHELTPTRSLLFRYSALTFNAHLLHLDPTYARNVEGHRNLLVHGPLTLTLMLRALSRHLNKKRDSDKLEVVVSFEYRNLAPLYCDEQMRVCVKNRKAAGATNIWDVWIEGPTGGMAVKAVARTVQSEANKLNALNKKEAGPAQQSGLSKGERRRLRKQGRRENRRLRSLERRREQRQQERSTQNNQSSPVRGLSYLYSASSPLVVQVPHEERGKPPRPGKESFTPSSQSQRSQQAGRALGYLYIETSSPLLCPVMAPRQRKSKPKAKTKANEVPVPQPVPQVQQPPEGPSSRKKTARAKTKDHIQQHSPYSRKWPQQQTGEALTYLYSGSNTPLLCPVEVPRQPTPAAASTSDVVSKPDAVPVPVPVPVADTTAPIPTLAQRQRAVLLASTPTFHPKAEDRTTTTATTTTTAAEIPTSTLRIRRIGQKGEDAEAQTQSASRPATKNALYTAKKAVYKVGVPRVRKVDVALRVVAGSRAHERRVSAARARRGGVVDQARASEEKAGAE